MDELVDGEHGKAQGDATVSSMWHQALADGTCWLGSRALLALILIALAWAFNAPLRAFFKPEDAIAQLEPAAERMKREKVVAIARIREGSLAVVGALNGLRLIELTSPTAEHRESHFAHVRQTVIQFQQRATASPPGMDPEVQKKISDLSEAFSQVPAQIDPAMKDSRTRARDITAVYDLLKARHDEFSHEIDKRPKD